MEKKVNDFNLKLAGIAGDGILNAGMGMFAKTAKRAGLYVFASAEYPSLIRGGHNFTQVSVSKNEVFGPSAKIDFLIALDQ